MTFHDLLHLPIVHLTSLMLLAVFLGGLIGWERERHERPAGLRTHILVCLSSTLITIVSNSFSDNGGRIAAQIVTGVGFLGAGTIMRSDNGGAIRGLTTAASLWTVAGLGIAIGFGGLYAQTAVVCTMIVLFTLIVLNKIDNRVVRQRRRQLIAFVLKASENTLQDLGDLIGEFRKHGIRIRDLTFKEIPNGVSVEASVHLTRTVERETVEGVLDARPTVIHYEWID